MTPEQFVAAVRAEVIDNSGYQEILRTPFKDVTDPYWRKVIDLYQRLDPNDKEVIASIFRQVAVDTISEVLGILDGVADVASFPIALELTCSGTQLNGDLQDYFLAEQEGKHSK